MLARQILNDVRRELLEFGAQNFWSDAELLRHLNRAESDYVNKTRLLEDSAQLSLVEGRPDYPLPSNWLSARLVMLQRLDESGKKIWTRVIASNLEKTAQESVRFLDNAEEDRGTPHSYYIWGSTLNLVPAPNAEAVGNLFLFYKSKPLALTNPDTDHIHLDDTLAEALTAFVLWKAWTKEKETDLAEVQKQTYLEYVAEGRRWVKKKNEMNRFDIISGSSFNSASWPLI